MIRLNLSRARDHLLSWNLFIVSTNNLLGLGGSLLLGGRRASSARSILRSDLSVTTLTSEERSVSLILTPVGDEGLADSEQHDGDLSNGKEAPDRSLLHQVRADKSSEVRSEDEEEDTLDDHTLLLVQSEKWGEHAEGVDGSTWDDISRISHWDRPSQMVDTVEGAELLTAEPLSGSISVLGEVESGVARDQRQKVTSKQHTATDDTQALDDDVTINVLGVLGERAVDDMAEVWLHADVKETSKGQHLVDQSVAERRVQIRSNDEVLQHLQELHGEEEEHTASESSVVGLAVDPPRAEETNGSEDR